MNKLTPVENPMLVLFEELPLKEKTNVVVQAVERAKEIISTAMVMRPSVLPGDEWLEPVLSWARSRTHGCGPKIAEAVLAATIKMVGCRQPHRDVTTGYIGVMAGYPADLLMQSVKACIEKESYHVLPTCGALLAVAKETLAARQEKLDLLARGVFHMKRAEADRARLAPQYSPEYVAQARRERAHRTRKS